MIEAKRKRAHLRLVPAERGAPSPAAAEDREPASPSRSFEETLLEGLRTPLREAELHLDSLLRGEWGALTEEQRRALYAAREAASVVDEILSLAGCPAEDPEKTGATFELRFLLWDAADGLSPLARARRVSLSVRPGPRIALPLAWRSGLSMLLRLLLHEHVHGAGWGGWVDVQIDEEGGEALLRIRHGGPGPLPLCRPDRLVRSITERFLARWGGRLQAHGREWALYLPLASLSSAPERETSSAQ